MLFPPVWTNSVRVCVHNPRCFDHLKGAQRCFSECFDQQRMEEEKKEGRRVLCPCLGSLRLTRRDDKGQAASQSSVSLFRSVLDLPVEYLSCSIHGLFIVCSPLPDA